LKKSTQGGEMKAHLRKLHRVSFFAFSLFSIGFAGAIDLKGKVVNEQGEPIKKASVALCKQGCKVSTDQNGLFEIVKSSSAVSWKSENKPGAFIGIKAKFLELGNCYDANITVVSIKGEVLNQVSIVNQNRVPVDVLVPPSAKTQALIISAKTAGGTISIKTLKCGSRWLWNDQHMIQGSHGLVSNRSALVALDTLVVEKDGKEKVTVPVTSLIATMPDIVLHDAPDPDQEGMVGDVEFSEPSRTFKTAISVKLSTKISNAKIRYTTDGQLPGSTSTLYSGDAIAISQTTQLRAAAFVADTLTGNVSTAIYIARDFDYTSDIPIIIMEGYGGGKPADKYNFIDLGFMTFEPVNGVASLDNPPTLVTRAGYHLRGQSSMLMFEQAPYRVELWDNHNKDADYPVLGMPKSSDWAFISPCTDNTLIRNVLVFDLGKAMGLHAVQYRFAEVFINQDGGGLEKLDYEGIYAVIQPIKNRKTTLDLKKLKPEDTDPLALSGGYIFKFDQAVKDSGMLLLQCKGARKLSEVSGGIFGGTAKKDSTATCWDDLELVDPSEPNQQQIDWITDYIQKFHDALHAKPIGDWKSYIDVNSFVNNQIVNEVTRNVDGWIRSHYMFKDRDGLITAGPIWDYNFALGNMTDMTWSMGTTKKTGWHVLDNRTGSGDWHTMMWKQPEYKSAVKARYLELRGNILSDDSIVKLIDVVRKPILNVAQRNFEAWPMGKCMSSGSFFGSGAVKDTTWSGQIDSLKIWTKKRLKTLDSLMTTIQ
jgi:hypothetical protein